MFIGIKGKAGAGKDTMAGLLRKELENMGNTVIIDHFAYDLKRIASEEFNWDGEKDEKGRRLLQVLGTEAGRDYEDSIWIDKVNARVEKNIGFANYWIFPDTRFENEVAYIRGGVNAMDGILIEIQRPDLDTQGKEYTHVSETAIDGLQADFVVVNDGDIEDLRTKAKGFIKMLKTGLFRLESSQ